MAVLDTGVDAAAADLSGRILGGADFTGTGAAGADANGHGTHVAGVIAARGNNGAGIAGVCWDCRILSVKVCDDSGVKVHWTAKSMGVLFRGTSFKINVSFPRASSRVIFHSNGSRRSPGAGA